MPRADDSDEAPVRKKKKKKKKAPPRRPLIAGIAGGGGVVLVLLILAVTMFRGGSAPTRPITDFDRYLAEENEFGFDYPADWKAKGYGLSGKREIEVKGGRASITVKESLVGGLVGDISSAATGGREVDDEHTPVAQVHESLRPKAASSYDELPAVTVMSKAAGKVRRSEFTDGSRHGYRATARLGQTALAIYCECPSSDWEILRPAFEQVIASVGRGQ